MKIEVFWFYLSFYIREKYSPYYGKLYFLGGITMLVIAFIVVFIVGAIAGIVGEVLYAKHIMNMTFDEMGRCGDMLIKAGNNRESMIELTIDNDDDFDYDSFRLEKR